MADNTPTRSTRFPNGLDDRFTDYRDERQMTNSEALRSLVRAGIEAEEDAVADSGEVLDSISKLRREQRREQRADALHNALVGAAIVFGVVVLGGIASGPVALGAAALLGLALIGTSLYPVLAGASDWVES